MPVLCQRIADLDVLADLVRRKNSKLRFINGGRSTDSVPGHHILKNLVVDRNIQFQSREQYGNIHEPVSNLLPISPAISLHISRAVFPVLAIWVLANFAYRSVILMFEWTEDLGQLVKIAPVHHVPGSE